MGRGHASVVYEAFSGIVAGAGPRLAAPCAYPALLANASNLVAWLLTIVWTCSMRCAFAHPTATDPQAATSEATAAISVAASATVKASS